jgi:hypothetical protein
MFSVVQITNGTLDVAALVTLVTATQQQQHQHRALSAQVQPVTRANVNFQLLHVIAQWLAITQIAVCQTDQSRPDLSPCPDVLQVINALCQRCLAL